MGGCDVVQPCLPPRQKGLCDQSGVLSYPLLRVVKNVSDKIDTKIAYAMWFVDMGEAAAGQGHEVYMITDKTIEINLSERDHYSQRRKNQYNQGEHG